MQKQNVVLGKSYNEVIPLLLTTNSLALPYVVDQFKVRGVTQKLKLAPYVKELGGTPSYFRGDYDGDLL